MEFPSQSTDTVQACASIRGETSSITLEELGVKLNLSFNLKLVSIASTVNASQNCWSLSRFTRKEALNTIRRYTYPRFNSLIVHIFSRRHTSKNSNGTRELSVSSFIFTHQISKIYLEVDPMIYLEDLLSHLIELSLSSNSSCQALS